MASAGDSHPRRVALIGLRGAGKTTVGRILAPALGGECVDTDDRIVERAGMNIAEIFKAEGESGFRTREHDVIVEVAQDPPRVICVGGGAVLDEANVERLRGVAVVFWLQADPEILWQRVSRDHATQDSRPPLTDRAGVAEWRELAKRRDARYRLASHAAIDTTGKTPEVIAREIIKRLSDFL